MTIPRNTRTYLPKLLTVLLITCNYILRYKVTIMKYLPPTAEPALDAVVTSCQVLSAIVSEEIPPDA